MESFNVLDLFAGIGGLSLGLDMSGFHTKWAVEMDEHCCSTLLAIHPDAFVFNETVDDFLIKSRDEEANYPAVGEVDAIVGGPPCQAVSSQNFQVCSSNPYKDPRNRNFFSFLEAVRYFRPKLAVMENVAGMVTRSFSYFCFLFFSFSLFLFFSFSLFLFFSFSLFLFFSFSLSLFLSFSLFLFFSFSLSLFLF